MLGDDDILEVITWDEFIPGWVSEFTPNVPCIVMYSTVAQYLLNKLEETSEGLRMDGEFLYYIANNEDEPPIIKTHFELEEIVTRNIESTQKVGCYMRF